MADLIAVITQLKQQRQVLSAQLKGLDAALAALTGGTPSSTRKATPPQARKGKTMSAAQRKAVSARMKKYWASRRKAKG